MISPNTTLTDAQIETLSYVYLLSLSLSLIGSLSVMLVAFVKRRDLNEQAPPLLQLALSDFLAAAILISTSIMNFARSDDFLNRVSVCEHLLPLSLAFYCVSFLLAMVYAWESKHVVQRWRERSGVGDEPQSPLRRKNSLVILYAHVWYMPIILYFLYVITLHLTPTSLQSADKVSGFNIPESNERSGSHFCTSCILLLHIWTDGCSDADKDHDLLVRCFVLIGALTVITCCTVVYYKVGYWFKRYQEAGLFAVEGDALTRRRLRGVYTTMRSMVLVIIFCWTPALVLTSLSFTGTPQVSLFPLYTTQALTMSLQGFLNSVVYAWCRQNFRDAVLGERLPLLTGSTHQAFFEESLRGPA